MKTELYSNKVITRSERTTIQNKIGDERMEHLIVEILIPSLEAKFSKKYKQFLKVMETNEDVDLQSAAKILGK